MAMEANADRPPTPVLYSLRPAVNWAVRFTNAHLRSTSDVSLKQLVVTVTDADSFIPELYVTELEKGMRDVDDPYMTIFSPPMIFARNAHEVPASVRVTDYIWSVMVAQNLSNARGMNFPCSTYSLSMVLADKVGYWDTGFNAIGEDMHMWVFLVRFLGDLLLLTFPAKLFLHLQHRLLKCYFATSGMARGHPIWVPINLTNVQTSGGYLSNMWARYVQAKRHYYGSADVAYALRQTFRGQGGLLRMLVSASKAEWRVFLARLLCCFYVLEAHLVPLTSGWLMFLGVPILQLAGGASLFSSSQALTALYWTVNGLSVSLIIPMIVNVLLYESYVRFVDRELFMKRADDKSIRRWWNIRDYAFLPVGAVLFMTLPATVSSLTALLTMGKEQKYVVSEKVVALDDSDLEDVKLV